MEQEKQLNRMDDRNGDINPYRELIVNNAEKTESPMTKMEQWSILSNVSNYVQHSKFNSMNYTLNVRPVNSIRSTQIQEKNLGSYSSTEFTGRVFGHV